MRLDRRNGPWIALLAGAAVLCLAHGSAHAQQSQASTPAEASSESAEPESELSQEPVPAQEGEEPEFSIAVLGFRIHSARQLGYLTESLADLLAARLAAIGSVEVVPSTQVSDALGSLQRTEMSDAELRRLAERVDAAAVVTGSLTELAGRFSLDVRVTPAEAGARSRTIVVTAPNEAELLGRLDELAERIYASAAGADSVRIVSIEIEGAGDLRPVLLGSLALESGSAYDGDMVRAEQRRLEEHPDVASVAIESERTGDGVLLTFKVVRTEMIFGRSVRDESTARVAEIRIRGNRRIEGDAIRARIRTKVGDAVRTAQVAGDVREVFALGFFRNVVVLSEETPRGLILTFQVDENPVIRQIAITGNDNLENEKVRDALTLTTGATLDYPLLHENTDRIEALYRAEGYYLATVDFEIETLSEGSVSVNFDVRENEKLKLREIVFIGNEAYDDSQLAADFSTKKWRFWSYATSWFDKSGTYSEPVFMRDLRTVEKQYTDDGYLQVEIGEPQVEPIEDEGLVVTVDVREGPQFHVGEIAVSGDDTMDLDVLREKLQLEQGNVFNRSYLTEDVEALEEHYTDRGFYFASVQPGTQLSEESEVVDVNFVVEKGPLYFIRHVNVAGNTRTVDPVIRREMQMTEGELYSARAMRISNTRVRNLGFFEDVTFEPRTTEDPSQLDLDVNVVERPTGSFSFGAGFSSRDKLVLTASLSQSNLFGRGYGVNLSADIGGSTNRVFLSASDPYVFGSDFSLGTTIFWTKLDFDGFEQESLGVDFQLGHALNEENTSRGFLRYSYAQQRIDQANNVNAAAVIFRERLQGNKSTSLAGASFRTDTRDDRLSPTSGMFYGGTLEYAGIGGFSQFLRAEARFSWYLGAPDWLIDRSTFVFSTRVGYTLPFNTIADYEFPELGRVPGCELEEACINVAPLDQIDTDLTLPLTERYFLGGIGTFQLRGYKSRSVGPRRAILQRSGVFGEGDLFHPVGTYIQTSTDPVTGAIVREAICAPVDPVTGLPTQGNGNDKCNNINDKNSFEDESETDIVGGNSFISTSVEYRFPISEEIGLQGVVFFDMGNAFSEGENLFDVTEWRYGYGGGLLWFSPFGPLQVVLGFPVDPFSFEKSPVFEFSVGGFGP